MNKSRIIAFFRPLLPLLVFVLLAGFFISSVCQSYDPTVLLPDEAYTDMVIARNLTLGEGYSLSPPALAPVSRGSLWQTTLLGAAKAHIDLPGFSLLAGMVMMLLVIVLSSSLARHSMPFLPFLVAYAAAIGFQTKLLASAVSGGAAALAVVFLMFAVCRHISVFDKCKAPFPFSAALWTGLASLMYIELSVLWIIFLLHALLVFASDRQYRSTISVWHLFLKWGGGLAVVTIALWPAVNWNMHPEVLGVPFPPQF